jgi:hypothetical protein
VTVYYGPIFFLDLKIDFKFKFKFKFDLWYKNYGQGSWSSVSGLSSSSVWISVAASSNGQFMAVADQGQSGGNGGYIYTNQVQSYGQDPTTLYSDYTSSVDRLLFNERTPALL